MLKDHFITLWLNVHVLSKFIHVGLKPQSHSIKRPAAGQWRSHNALLSGMNWCLAWRIGGSPIAFCLLLWRCSKWALSKQNLPAQSASTIVVVSSTFTIMRNKFLCFENYSHYGIWSQEQKQRTRPAWQIRQCFPKKSNKKGHGQQLTYVNTLNPCAYIVSNTVGFLSKRN